MGGTTNPATDDFAWKPETNLVARRALIALAGEDLPATWHTARLHTALEEALTALETAQKHGDHWHSSHRHPSSAAARAGLEAVAAKLAGP